MFTKSLTFLYSIGLVAPYCDAAVTVGEELFDSSLRRGGLILDDDETGDCISDTCKAAEASFMEMLVAMEEGSDSRNGTSRQLNPAALVPGTYFEDPTSLFQGCLDDNVQVNAVASSSSSWRQPDEAWLASIANNGRYECNEMYCHDYDAWPAWFACPEDEDGIQTGGENFHFIQAGPGVATGKYFELEWEEAQCLCQIWIDTKAFLERYPCGRDKRQTAPNRVLNADIQYWDSEQSDWVTVGSKMDANDDWGFVFPECVTSNKLRLFNVGTGEDTSFQARNPILYELKVYNCESECGPGKAETFVRNALEDPEGKICDCYCPA